MTTNLIFRATAIAFSLLLFSFNAALAECPTPEWVCDFYPPVLGYQASPTGWCEGPDCFDKAYGEESTIVATDDVLFPYKWKMRQSGVLMNVSCATLDDSASSKTTIWLPEVRHCAVAQQTENHFYLHFIASNPVSQCLGWVECKVY
jgi:hypothetical protein